MTLNLIIDRLEELALMLKDIYDKRGRDEIKHEVDSLISMLHGYDVRTPSMVNEYITSYHSSITILLNLGINEALERNRYVILCLGDLNKLRQQFD